MIITEILVPAQNIAWLPWAVHYFFYIGSAYGAALLLTLLLFRQPTTMQGLRAVLAAVLAISAVIGPLALTAELHQPGRAWHFFAYFTPGSWMSRGAILLPIFSLLSMLTAWLLLRSGLQHLNQHPNRMIRSFSLLSLGQRPTSLSTLRMAAVITLLSGLSIALYTGMEVAMVASRPLWNQFLSPLLWFVTAFLGTGGLTLLMLIALKQPDAEEAKCLRQVVLVSAVLACLLFPAWLINGEGLALLQYAAWRWCCGLLMLLFVSCIGLAYRRTTAVFPLLSLGVLAIIASWSLRWITLIEVQTVPRYDAGLYPHAFTWHLPGGLGLAGLWLALAIMLSGVITRTQPTHRTAQTSTVQGEYHE